MKPYKKYIFHGAIALLGLLCVILFFKYKWWFLGSLQEFKIWYPNFNIYLWFAKFILILSMALLVIFLIIALIKFLLNSKFIYLKVFIVYIVLLIFLEGNHPFTMVKMYSSLADDVSIFYIDDCKGHLLPLNKFGNENAASLSHYYYSFSGDKNIDIEDIGKMMWQQIGIIENKGTCYCLKKELIKTKHTEKLYETCN